MSISLFIMGIIVGVCKVIPGLSGAVMMISFNIYDRGIRAVSCFFDNVKDNSIFLINFGVGVLVGIVCFSNIINYFISNYYLYTISLFSGLILGGIPSVSKDMNKGIRGYFIFIISFIFMFVISYININNNFIISNNIISYLYVFLAGFVEAMGTIIPGISSTALLMVMGVYNIYINILSNLFNYGFIISNIYFILFFGVGLLFGIIMITFIVNYFFNRYRKYSFSFIVGVCLSNVIYLISNVILGVNNFYSLLLIILVIYIGYYIGRKI